MQRHAPERSCVVCRTKAPQGALVRLTLAPDGTAIVDFRGKLGGRGAWSHPACLSVLEKQPGRLQRPLRQKVPEGPWRAQFDACLQRALEDGLSMASAAGVLVGGHVVLLEALKHKQIVEVVVASNASDRTLRELRAASEIQFTTVSMDSAALGAQIGRGLRAAIGVKPSKAARHLRQQLRTLRALG